MGFTLQVWFGGMTERVEVDGVISESLTFFGSVPSPRTWSGAATFSDMHWYEAVGEGHLPDQAFAVLSKAGRIVIAGKVEKPFWGRRYEPVRFTIREEPWVSDHEFPPAYKLRYTVVDEEVAAELSSLTYFEGDPGNGGIVPAWLSLLQGEGLRGDPETPPILSRFGYELLVDKVEGRTYPFVFGSPGYQLEDGVVLLWPATPALFVDTDTGNEVLMSAGHEATRSIEAFLPYVRLFGENTDGDLIDISALSEQGVDSSERAVTLVPIEFGPGVDEIAFEITESDYWIAWSGAKGLPHLAGDLVRFILDQIPSIRIDRGSFETFRSQLNQYVMAGYVDKPVKSWPWLLEQLAVLPVSWVVGPDGLFLWLWDPDALPVYSFDEDSFFVTAPATVGTSEPVSKIQLKYRWRDDTGTHLRTAVSASNAFTEYARHSGGKVETYETRMIDDRTTAERCVALRQRAQCARHILIQGVVDVAALGMELRVGLSVRAHLPEYGIVNRRAIVTEIRDPGVDVAGVQLPLSVELTIIQDPLYMTEAA